MASMLLVNALSVVVLSAVIIASPVQESTQKIPVAVYYESYCADSVKFLTKQLYPVYTTPLVSYFNLTLVPFGKASYTRNESGAYTFNCHHGSKECIGNKVHACALNLLGSLDESFKFINCVSSMIMENPKTEEFPGPQCASKLSIKYENIEHCVTGPRGDELLAFYGNKTLALDPKLTFVPNIIFNEKYVDGESAKASANFRSALCAQISGTKPAECDAKNSAISGIHATIFSVVIPLVMSRISC